MNNCIIGKNVKIHPTAILYPNVILHDNVFVGPFCIIGEPVSSYYKDPDNHSFIKTEIGEGSVIRSNTIIYEGCSIGANFQTGHHVTIREKTVIGNNCSVGTLSDIQKQCVIKDYVRIHSNVFMGEFTMIDSFAWIMPRVVFTNDKYPPHDNLEPVKVGKYSVVCANSVILPNVKLGDNSFVAAGAVVSKNIEDGRVVRGIPARDICSIEEIKDKNGNIIYPWNNYLKEYRGYPWQTKDEVEV